MTRSLCDLGVSLCPLCQLFPQCQLTPRTQRYTEVTEPTNHPKAPVRHKIPPGAIRAAYKSRAQNTD